MNELIDKFLFELFDGLRDKTTVLFGEFIADAQALAAIFMLLYFGVESFKMMSGDKKLEIIPLLRPFALGLVLMFWIPFINLISYPGELLTAQSKAMFTNQIDEVELLSRNRYALIDSVAVELLHTSLEVERAENEVKDKKWYDFSIDFSAIGDKIAGLYVYVVAKVKMIMFNIIEFIVVTFWQVCTYFVFFLQIIFTGILVILGPLAFAFSVLPAFRDAYIQWIARFVSVSLYSCIAYIVLSISLVVMQYGIEREIEILPAGKRFSDGSRAHLPNAVPAGAARIASAGSGRRFRLLDGRHQRHALFLGTRPPRGAVSSATARERGRGGAGGSKLAGRGCDRSSHAAGADGEAAGRVAAAGPVPLLSGGALPPRLHGVRRLLPAHLSR